MMQRIYPGSSAEEAAGLARLAGMVLRRNDAGGWTRPGRSLYPHQWSWDSAFIAIGLAHLDVRRAASELETLFDHQWKGGKVPHIVFDPGAPAGSYFPGPDYWDHAASSLDVPPNTSGLCQPPVHAIAALRIWESARGLRQIHFAHGFLRSIYPKLLSWHRYLATARDPEGSGLVTIFHPWESGTDNSPRWDAALANVEVGELEPYARLDLQHVEDASQRPTDAEYDRYLWLVQSMKRVRCEDGAIYEEHPFLVKDVLFSSILAAANEALLEIAEIVGAPEDECREIEASIQRGLRGLDTLWDPEMGLYLDRDLRSDLPLKCLTVAGFSPLIAGHLDRGRLDALLDTLDSPAFAGNPDLRWALPPSTSPLDPGFHPRSYWRGPVWPVINWLLCWSLERAGEPERADGLRRDSLAQLTHGGFGEYFEPVTGGPLGSADQSWSAAVALDWLADEERSEAREAA